MKPVHINTVGLCMALLGTGLWVTAQNTNDTFGADPSSTRDLTKPEVSFAVTTTRDPMLSPDDLLILKHREEQRAAAEAAERKRLAEEERKRLAEEERRRQYELMLIKDPTILVRDKIKIGGIIDKEVLIGNKL